jgi:hypothetical protein
MKAPVRVPRLVVGAAVLAVLGACTGPPGATTSAVAIPVCAGVTPMPNAEAPAGLPDGLPLPPDLAISGRSEGEGRVTIDGIVPMTLQDAATFMTRELPAAGFGITDSDAEQDEAEGSFSGAGATGRFRLHGIAGCPDAITFALTVSSD